MKFSYTLTSDEYATGITLFMEKSWYFIIGILYIIYETYNAVIDDYYINSPQWPFKLLTSLVIYSISCFMFYIVMKWGMHWLLKRKYRSDKCFSKTMYFVLNDNGVEIEHAVGNTFLQWKAYDKFRCSDDLCILYLFNSMRQIIPLRIFNEGEIKDLKALLAKNIKAPIINTTQS